MDTSLLPNKQCYDAIDKIAQNEGLIDYDLEISSGSSKGDNYMGEMRRVAVRAKKSEKVLNLIIESAPILDAVRTKIPVEVIYNREIVAYTEVFRALEDVQRAVDVSRAMKFDFVRCYYASQEPMVELLILEDLKTQGFKMLEKPGTVRLEHAKLVITSLAKLHAVSFILKKQDPEGFSKIANKCVPDISVVFEDFAIFLEKSLDLAAKIVENPLHKCKILEVKENYLEHWRECLGGGAYSVICHGDCWINNIMFKDQEGMPVDARLHDYQILRYGLPAADVLYFLFTSTDGELRRASYTNCLDLYHETLAIVLEAYSYDIEDVFAKALFETQVKKLGRFAFIGGIAACKPMVMEGEEIVNVEDLFQHDEMGPPKGAAFDRYRKKLTDVIVDCIEYGYV